MKKQAEFRKLRRPDLYKVTQYNFYDGAFNFVLLYDFSRKPGIWRIASGLNPRNISNEEARKHLRFWRKVVA